MLSHKTGGNMHVYEENFNKTVCLICNKAIIPTKCLKSINMKQKVTNSPAIQLIITFTPILLTSKQGYGLTSTVMYIFIQGVYSQPD